MSDKLVIIGGAIGLLAACVVLGYRYACSRSCISLASFLTIVFSTVGVISGVVLVYLAFSEDNKNLGSFADFRLPLIAGGISLVWVSLQGVIAECKRPNPESSVSAQPDTGLLLNKPSSQDAPR